MSGKKVLVTGATGFIGGHVIEELLRQGYSIRATDLPQADARFICSLGVEFVSSNLLDTQSLSNVLQGMDKVIHLAACFDFKAPREKAFAVNVTGTENLCHAALEAGVDRFVHFSTAGVYGRPRKVPVYEDDPKYPVENDYVITKWWGEKVAWRYYKNHGLPVTVIRPTTVYGPRAKYFGSIFFGLTALLLPLKRKKIHLVRGGVESSWIRVEDVAGMAVFLLEAEKAVGRAFNGSDGKPVSAESICRALITAFGMEYVPFLSYPRRFLRVASIILERMPDIFFRRLTMRLRRNWDRIVLRYDLEPALTPFAERGTSAYAGWDMVFSNQAIIDLGYRFKYPHFDEAFQEVVRWYKDNRWIPDI